MSVFRYHETCEVCGRVVKLTNQQRQGIHGMLNFYCSKACLESLILNAAYEQPLSLRVKEPVVDPNGLTCYSRKLNKSFRSFYELHVAEWLHDLHEPFAYEPFGVAVGEDHTLTLDFFLQNRNVLIEVKGRWSHGQYSKMTRFVKEYPDVPVILIPWWLHSEFYPKSNSRSK